MEPQFLSDAAPIQKSANRLPHWKQLGTVYFVTFRLADALPRSLVRDLEVERSIWLSRHPEPWSNEVERDYFNRFPRKLERWLDEGRGECILRNWAAAKIVGEALNHSNGTHYRQLCWVIMPNHAHVVFAPIPPVSLSDILQTWKSYSAHALNRRLGRSGQVWQKDYFDRIVRDQEHFINLVGYIRRNPMKAGLREGEFLLWESDCAKGF